MNTEYFIARKIAKGDGKNKISKPIIRISILSIILGIIVMIISVSVVTGFQSSIREKVISFGAHIQISELNQDFLFENKPVLIEQDFLQEIEKIEGIKNIQAVGYKPGILQSGRDSVPFTLRTGEIEKDTFLMRQEIKSVLVKGVQSDFDWEGFKSQIEKGKLPSFHRDSISDEILISRKIASQIHLDTGDYVRAYFIDHSGPKIRQFKVSGIYHTGLEEFDEEIVFADLKQIQKLNNWGIETYLNLSDTCFNGQYVLEVNTVGGNKNYMYDWLDGSGFSHYSKMAFCPHKDTTFSVTVSDFEQSNKLSPYETSVEIDEALSIPDTATISIHVEGKPESCLCNTNPDSIIYAEDGMSKTLYYNWGKIEVKLSNSGGSSRFYCGGFEASIDDWKNLVAVKNAVYDKLPFDMKAKSIAEIYPEIFSWLDFLDTNVIIIITLMVIIAIINMSSALLVLILEKTNMIGMLKALGANSWSVRKIFLYLSGFLILRGLFWGNLFGIGLILIQLYFEPLKLDPEIYYVEAAPVKFNWIYISLINGGTLIVCILMLILPSIIINRISPIKAIRFD